MKEEDNGSKGRDSEALVNKFCSKLFLDYWTFHNPVKDDNKELCDCLIVFHGAIIIISVKNCRGTKVERRWFNRAIYDSKRQIDGAERYIASGAVIRTADGKTITVPKSNKAVIVRIGIAFGHDDSFRPIDNVVEETDGKFYHWFDDKSFAMVFSYVVTFCDFIRYLGHRESYYCDNSDKNKLNDYGLLALHLDKELLILLKDYDDMENASHKVWQAFLSSECCSFLLEHIQKNEYYCYMISEAFRELLDSHNDMPLAEMILGEFTTLPLKSRCVFIDKFMKLNKSEEQFCDYLEVSCPANNKRKGIVLLVDGDPIEDDYSEERRMRQNKLAFFCNSLCNSNHWDGCIGFATNKHREGFGSSADYCIV